MRQKVRTLMLKARIYRFIALAFAVVGLILFGAISLRNMNQGGIGHALADPSLIATLIMTFLPAAVLSWQAQRLDRRFRTMIQDISSGTPPR